MAHKKNNAIGRHGKRVLGKMRKKPHSRLISFVVPFDKRQIDVKRGRRSICVTAYCTRRRKDIVPYSTRITRSCLVSYPTPPPLH